MRNAEHILAIGNLGAEDDDLFRPDEAGASRGQAEAGEVDQDHLDLLADVRNFVAFQVCRVKVG